MNDYFRNVNVKIEMNPTLKYGDFRDWFIIDPYRPKIYETEIQFFINDEFFYKDMMPINTKNIKYVFKSSVNFEMCVKKIKWIVPEMGYEKETIFNNPAMVTHFDTLSIDGEINFEIGEKE